MRRIHGIKDSIGDIAVLHAIVAAFRGMSLRGCMEEAWNEIKDRKGYTNDHGVFVREPD